MPNPYIELAERAITYVNAHIASPNREADRKKYGEDVLLERFNEAHHEIWLSGNALESRSAGEYQRRAEIALKFRIGNCEAKATVALDLLASHPLGHPRLELMSLRENSEQANLQEFIGMAGRVEAANVAVDHVFLVIGRSAGTRIADYTTWNQNAVVCDPWTKRTYECCNLAEEMALIRSVSGTVTETVQEFVLEADAPW